MELVEGTTRQEPTAATTRPPGRGGPDGVAAGRRPPRSPTSRAWCTATSSPPTSCCQDERVMVADFGIAKLGEGGDHTQEGTMPGTAYLAPSRWEGPGRRPHRRVLPASPGPFGAAA